jgi:hypothetical protein
MTTLLTLIEITPVVDSEVALLIEGEAVFLRTIETPEGVFCNKCFFKDKGISEGCDKLVCSAEDRPDGKNVHFIDRNRSEEV